MLNNIKSYTINIKNTPGLVLPKLGEGLASGYDIVASSASEVVGTQILPGVWRRIDYIQYHTNLFIEPINIKSELVCDLTDDFYNPTEEVETIETYLQCFIYPRSSITKYNLMLKNGTAIIDVGYRNEILLRFAYQIQPEDFVPFDLDKSPCFGVRINEDKIYKSGDKIGQMIFSEISPRIKFNIVENLGDSERGLGGFGSTDKK